MTLNNQPESELDYLILAKGACEKAMEHYSMYPGVPYMDEKELNHAMATALYFLLDKEIKARKWAKLDADAQLAHLKKQVAALRGEQKQMDHFMNKLEEDKNGKN